MSHELPGHETLAGKQARVWFEGDLWMSGTILSGTGDIEVSGQAPCPVVAGTPVVVELGLPAGVYRFRSQLRRNEGRSLVFALPAPGTVEHQQRRQYYRVDVDLPARLRSGAREVPARLLNLSAGGVRVKTLSPPTPGTTVDIVFDLEGRPLTASGKVVRVLKGEDGEAAEVGLRFLSLKPGTEDRIVGYAFARQAKGSRRGG